MVNKTYVLVCFVIYACIGIYIEGLYEKNKDKDVGTPRRMLGLFYSIVHNVYILIMWILVVKIIHSVYVRDTIYPSDIYLLNILQLYNIMSFLIFKRCILTILTNNALGYNEHHVFATWLRHIYERMTKGKMVSNCVNNENPTLLWINGNKGITFVVLALNVYLYYTIVAR
jgi:membrane-associated HD superfamily phosphohydrolase